jgi:hypothetical protein
LVQHVRAHPQRLRYRAHRAIADDRETHGLPLIRGREHSTRLDRHGRFGSHPFSCCTHSSPRPRSSRQGCQGVHNSLGGSELIPV